MRMRTGNPHHEAHDTNKRVYDWVAPETIKAADIPGLIAAALPNLKLEHTGDHEVNGAVYTSRRPDGSLYVCIELYDHECADPDCAAGHWDSKGQTIRHRKAPALTTAHQNKIKQAVGEHSEHKLGVGDDEAVLHRLGFTDNDSPLRG